MFVVSDNKLYNLGQYFYSNIHLIQGGGKLHFSKDYIKLKLTIVYGGKGMLSKLSRWLCQKGCNVTVPVQVDKQTEKERKRARELQRFYFDLADWVDDVERCLLRVRAKCLWLYDRIRSRLVRNEFDHSLNFNLDIALPLDSEEYKAYQADLIKRRLRVHLQDLDRTDKAFGIKPK